MKLHTVFVTYNRLELTKQAIESYLETVAVPFTAIVVDNASSDGSRDWLFFHQEKWPNEGVPHVILQDENHYPGFATNRGWGYAPQDATHLHRADNDFAFLPSWCDEVEERFQNPKLGQLGLRTDEEEMHAPFNVGGNCVIRRELWDQGLRWDETPWPELPTGYSEDSFFSPAVVEMGYEWSRVKVPCIRSLASGDWGDPYYQRSYGDRGIVPDPADPTAPGTR